MSSKKIFLVLLIIGVVIIFFLFNQKVSSLTSPASKQNQANQVTPTPSTSSYNPPAQVQYDSSTDLQKELESINPQVLDEDFSGL
ncbi:hypothetical protein HY383_02645 [Candidatus Daviesbacteria bacterium]|nr:hypothetical protein [Candidatus Daviesbacteria bacterium]